jgi:serine/threonine protein kinase
MTERSRSHVLEEAKALCRVEHPNIVRFYSIASHDASSLIAVAMEYLDGTSLESRLGAGALSLEETLAVGAAIASALSAVHRAGLVHRDVKPANIVDSGGTYKLIDFGIAWEELGDQAIVPVLVDDLPFEMSVEEKAQIKGAMTLRREPSSLRISGSRSSSGPRMPSGTVGYLDPHCVRTFEPATAASDIYALGVVLFECVTGKHPAAVAAGEGAGLRGAVLDGRERSPLLATVEEGLPESFCRLVDRMLEPDPARRQRSADWIAIELERIRAELAGGRRELPPEDVGPFRGLGRFEHGDRDVYFGRSSETAAALELLRTHGLVALVGPSGSGKSSLARAGVLPRASEGALGRGLEGWDLVAVSPGLDPRATILASVRALLSETNGASPGPDAPEPPEVVAALAGERSSSSISSRSS